MGCSRMVRLGELVEECGIQCGELQHYDISGIDINKQFIKSVAKVKEDNLPKYLKVPTDCFACNLMHVGRDMKVPVAYNTKKADELVSPAYYVFKVKGDRRNDVLSDYLQLLFSRNEFDRLAWFCSDSSIRGNLDWDRFCDIALPLPPISYQRQLVDIYKGLTSVIEENEALLDPLNAACQAYMVD